MPMNDRELCALIEQQSRQAIGADDYSEAQRARAMEFYLGEAKGELSPPDVPGRSRVVSKDLLDTVEWAMPSLMDIFASSDDIIRFEPDGPEDERACDDATNYVGWLIHRKNEDGFVTLHDAIKSALISRMGFGKTYVERHQEYREERYAGLTLAEAEALSGDPELEVVSQEPDGIVPPEALMPGLPPEAAITYEVVAKRASEAIQFKNEGVPPEEIRLSKDTRVLSDCDFIEHRRPVTLSYLREQGYDEDKISLLNTDAAEADFSDDATARHSYDGSWDDGDNEPDEAQRKVELSEAYLRVDFDGDGRIEYRKVIKAGTQVFENEVVDDHPFWLMTPILMPYKAIGLGYYDLVEDLQRIKTALNRQILDNVYLSNNPITEVVVGKVDLDDVLNPRPGGIRKVKELGMTREVAVPFVAGAGMQIVEQIDQLRDTRTGVTEMNSAVNAESLSKGSVGSEGVQAMMNAGAQRLRLIARVLAETGFKRMYYLMLKNVSQHTDRVQQVKINGRWLQVDPREWKNRYNMTVSVGVGTFGRQQQIANLSLIAQAQEKVLPLGLATPANIYQTAKRTVEAMGYRDADQFFTAPQEGQQPQGQQPEGSPEAQALIQAEQIKAQASVQNAQLDAQITLQKAEMDNATRLTVEREKIASQERVAMFEAQQRAAIQREQAARQPVAVNQ